jgi:hypothetical protein
VSEAYAKQRYLAGKMPDQRNADPGFLRRAGPGRNQDALWPHGFDGGDRHLVVAANLDLSAQFAKILDQVVGKRIVVVEHEDHYFIVDVQKPIRAASKSSKLGLGLTVLPLIAMLTSDFRSLLPYVSLAS